MDRRNSSQWIVIFLPYDLFVKDDTPQWSKSYRGIMRLKGMTLLAGMSRLNVMARLSGWPFLEWVVSMDDPSSKNESSQRNDTSQWDDSSYRKTHSKVIHLRLTAPISIPRRTFPCNLIFRYTVYTWQRHRHANQFLLRTYMDYRHTHRPLIYRWLPYKKIRCIGTKRAATSL